MRSFLTFLALLLFPASLCAQALADTVFSWKGYAETSECRVRLYAAPPQKERTRTVVLEELAENQGHSTVEDAAYLAEAVGRRFEIDPASAYWVFHWGAFSYENARPNRRKELFLRATFRRSKSGALGAPSWRVISREEVEDLTDRRFR